MSAARTYVALLRGVNVGGHGKIAMADLRRAFETSGYENVATYIQSGNVVFESDRAIDAADVQLQLAGELDRNMDVALRSAEEIAEVACATPFGDVDSKSLHYGFMSQLAAEVDLQALDLERFGSERAVIDGSNVFVHLPNGMGRAKLPVYLTKAIAVPVTFRNHRTVTKLAEMADRS